MAKKIFWSKFTFLAIFFLLMQQIIVASSTLWISNLGESVVEGKNITLYLTLFISSLFIVYIPGIISALNLERAKSKSIREYTHAFSETYQCTPTRLTEKEFQHEKEPWLTTESAKVIEETYSVAYDSIATGLNTILNIAALCLAISTKVMLGYLLSFFVLILMSNVYKNKLTEAAILLQNDRKGVSQVLLSGWDNILVGNQYNFSIWWKQFTKKWGAYNESATNAVLLTQLSSTFTVGLSLIPVAATFIWLFVTTSNTAKMIALVSTLPRQIQIIQHFQILSAYTMHWHGVYARVKELLSSITAPTYEKTSTLNRIKENEIDIMLENKPFNYTSFDQFIKTIAGMKSGRITLQGANGSGKTTLINLIKAEFHDRAFYLPTNSRLAFEKTLDNTHSTGQKVKSHLDELKSMLLDSSNSDKTPKQILLLDEWDANLDAKNKEQISAMLDAFSKNYCIIEIRHKHPQEVTT
jgi:ABC-type multidrug transport system fused ATPase/permease subunit